LYRGTVFFTLQTPNPLLQTSGEMQILLGFRMIFQNINQCLQQFTTTRIKEKKGKVWQKE